MGVCGAAIITTATPFLCFELHSAHGKERFTYTNGMQKIKVTANQLRRRRTAFLLARRVRINAPLICHNEREWHQGPVTSHTRPHLRTPPWARHFVSSSPPPLVIDRSWATNDTHLLTYIHAESNSATLIYLFLASIP
jgi:hypothetical protein